MRWARKGLCDLHLLLAVSLAAFALAFMATPNAAIIRWMQDTVGFPLWLIIAIYLICAMVIIIMRPPPTWLAVCAAPIPIYAFCVTVRFFTIDSAALSGVVVYWTAVWLAYRSIYRLID